MSKHYAALASSILTTLGTVLTALVMSWCLSCIEHWVDRIPPAVTKNFLKPMLIVLIGANLSLTVAWKTQNPELRQTALASASAILAGISEPALYGVAIRLKRPLIASLISGFVCGPYPARLFHEKGISLVKEPGQHQRGERGQVPAQPPHRGQRMRQGHRSPRPAHHHQQPA